MSSLRNRALAIAFGLSSIVGLCVSAQALIANGTSFNLAFCGGNNPCGPLGTVTITGDGTNTLSYAFIVPSGGFLHDTNGTTNIVVDIGGTVTGFSFSNTNFTAGTSNWSQV